MWMLLNMCPCRDALTGPARFMFVGVLERFDESKRRFAEKRACVAPFRTLGRARCGCGVVWHAVCLGVRA